MRQHNDGIMILIDRKIKSAILKKIQPNKVIVILGARRVGKTFLIKEITNELPEPFLLLNGEDINTHTLLLRRSVENYKQLLGTKRILIIDEAQKIPDIGHILKLMVDNIEGIKIIVTGSSAFDIHNLTGEPLTGRKFSFILYPISESELAGTYNPIENPDKLKQRLLFGNYPELLQLNDIDDKKEYLNEIVSSYLLKDILAFENIRNSDKIFNLLRLIAYQIGGEVSYQELGKQLSMSKNTVDKYLDLLSKVFILFKVEGFSRNLRKEISKSPRWYFYDNGIRNAIIANFSILENRNDIGQLWENYMISERLKYQTNNKIVSNNYFWRTYDQQEIDWVEERDGKLFGFEFKWAKQNIRPPKIWLNTYAGSSYEVITSENYLDWLL